ncbi:MAG TPA: pyrimidine/purine nucleoside phosphorylase [Bacteroidales bacterium]|nr:pyrimidine/purine nucleoside phosphorylase [Bacteroidales bacterium]
MFKVNEYFDGKVTSLGFETPEGKATIGVIAPGEYEFGTSTVEYMTVICGNIEALLPGETQWQTYKEFETFMVPKDTKFKMKTDSDTAYRCLYK